MRMNKTRESIVAELQEFIDVSCKDGNYNCNPYLHGMANGLIFAKSVVDGGEPKYMETPKTWLGDKPKKKRHIVRGGK
mgnify:CR=1 FL=1